MPRRWWEKRGRLYVRAGWERCGRLYECQGKDGADCIFLYIPPVLCTSLSWAFAAMRSGHTICLYNLLAFSPQESRHAIRPRCPRSDPDSHRPLLSPQGPDAQSGASLPSGPRHPIWRFSPLAGGRRPFAGGRCANARDAGAPAPRSDRARGRRSRCRRRQRRSSRASRAPSRCPTRSPSPRSSPRRQTC